MSWPAPAAWPTSARRLPSLTGGPNGGAGQPSRTWTLGEFCRRNKLPRSERSWDLFAAERYRRGETDTPSYEAYNPLRRHQWGPHP
jgi:hypothetical protein